MNISSPDVSKGESDATVREYHLKSSKWTTIATNYSLRPRHMCAEVWAPRVASWRRIGIIPGYGKFRRYLSAFLPFGIIQVKFRENRTCRVQIGNTKQEALPDHFPTDRKY